MNPDLYERAFSEGERAAFTDRQRGRIRERPQAGLSDWGAAWWEGYTPRTSAWAVRTARRPVPQMEAA
tara:strand:+ start:5081 stop:5284 length:204 start_codon:yes stop_codon:yes gene_type:complete